MKAPLLIHLSVWVQTVPALAYLISRQRTRTAAYAVAGALVSLLANTIGRILAEAYANNQVVSYISSPVSAAFFLGALAEFQQTPKERRVFRIGIVVFTVAWILLVAFVEDVTDFDLITAPLYSLTMVVAGLWTLLRRTAASAATPLLKTDWFWISLGLVVGGICTGIASPIGGLLIRRGEYELFSAVWQARAATVVASYLLLSWGVYRGPPVSRYLTVE